MTPKSFVALLSFVLALSFVACKSDEPAEKYPGGHTSPYPTCDQIIKTCHIVDVGDGPIHDCHDLGHGAVSDVDCMPKKDECLRICIAALEAGVGNADADADATADASEAGHAHADAEAQDAGGQ